MQRGIAIFDMDETLISSDFAWANTPEQLLYSLGITPEENLSALFHKGGFTKLISHLQNHYQLAFSAGEVFSRLGEFAREAYETLVTIKPGASAIIDQMRSEGYYTCILSANNPVLMNIVRSRFCEDLPLDAWFSTRELAYTKSEAKIYDLVSGYFGMNPYDCILFDDSESAVLTAHEAGIKAIRVMNGALEAEERYPYKCIQSLHDCIGSLEEVIG